VAATIHPLLAKGLETNSWAGTVGKWRVF